MTQQSHSQVYPKEMKSVFQSGICTPCALQLCTQQPRHGNHLRCPSMHEHIKKTWYRDRQMYTHTNIHKGILFSHKKGNPAICDNMDESLMLSEISQKKAK